MVRENLDGSSTPLTLPNHRRIKIQRVYVESAPSQTFPDQIFWTAYIQA